MKRKLVALVVLLVAVAAVAATPPVRWRTFVKKTSETTGVVTFRALVAPGWHLYGMSIPEGGPRATSFNLEDSKGVKFTGNVVPSREPLEVSDPLFDMTLTWWDANVEFSVPFRITDRADARIECKIGYMSCDGNECRPPQTEAIAVPVK